MAFKLTSRTANVGTDPEALFRDLRSRKVEGLLAQQADTLRSYMKNERETDLALELPTGSGKTLVGLLIAEWRRRRYQQRCVYLCPTIQLVHQVREQASEKYGISAIAFSGTKKKYPASDASAFLNCETIAIATYSALFNINPFFDDLGTIIFDDAHAAEGYVSGCWALEINRNKALTLFSAVAEIIKPYLPAHEQSSFEDDSDDPIDFQRVNKLPGPRYFDVQAALVTLFDVHCVEGELYFKWRMLREHMAACNLFYTSRSFLIRPILPPTESFTPFASANQRIYMSATLGEGGDLERIFGRSMITRVPAPSGWDKQGIGRRYFVFPMRVWSEDVAEANALSWIAKVPRCLILTPRDTEAERFSNAVTLNSDCEGYETVGSDEMEMSKKAFTNKEHAVAILSNRYDGIDLNGDECRYLIVSGLPESTNLQERFLITRMAAAALYHVRLRTRVTQAVGRCTRSATDWSLVVILGDKLHQYLSKPENRKNLHPELQAEINFGLEQSDVETELSQNIDVFLLQGEDWREADEYILEMREAMDRVPNPTLEALQTIVSDEVKYLNAMWNGQYAWAVACAKNVLANLASEPLRGYRAWWNYLAGNSAYLAEVAGDRSMGAVAKALYRDSAIAAKTIPWLNALTVQSQQSSSTSTNDVNLAATIERIELQFERMGRANSKKIERCFSEIRSGLGALDSKHFEAGQVRLGLLLGYDASNSEEFGAPDPWWVLGPDLGIVFEDYAPTSDDSLIPKSKVQQAKGHPDWLKEKYPNIMFSVIMCSTAQNVGPEMKPFLGGIFYCSVGDFRKFAEECLPVIRELWDHFSAPGDLVWRTEAMTLLTERRMTPKDIYTRLTKNALSSLAH